MGAGAGGGKIIGDVVLGLEGISLSFGGVNALQGVTFDVRVNSSDRAKFLKGPRMH